MIEVLKQALEAFDDRSSLLKWQAAREALRQAIAELESQWLMDNDPLPRACNLAGVDYQTFLKIKSYMPVSPPQRTKQEPVAHWSDCAVHSEPAYPKGECDCGGYTNPLQRTEPVSDDIASILACRDMLDAQPIPNLKGETK
jgi:hypothetical protein